MRRAGSVSALDSPERSSHQNEPLYGSIQEASLSTMVPADSTTPPATPVAAPSASIFFARVPSTLPYEELHVLFSKFGAVQHLNLFRRWPKARTSKGCGIVQYSSVQEASTALSALNGIHSFDDLPGSEGPMVVEWVDTSKTTPATPGTTDSQKKRSNSKHQSSASSPSSTHDGSNLRAILTTSLSRSSCCSSISSTSSSSISSQHSWQSSHHQQVSSGCSPAAAGAAISCDDPFFQSFGSVHPLDHDISNSLLSGHSLEGLGVLGGTMEGWAGAASNWGSDIPVHLMPMLLNQANTGVCSPSLPQLNSPGSAAAAAAIASFGTAAAGSSQMLAVSSPAPAGVDLLHMQPFSYPGSFLQFAGQQQQQQQLERQLPVLEDCWPVGMSPVSNSVNGLLGTSAMVGNMGIAPAGTAVVPPGQYPGERMLVGSASSSSSSGLLTPLSSASLGSMDPECSMPPAAAAAGAADVRALAGCTSADPCKLLQQLQHQELPVSTIQLELSDSSLCQLMPHVPAVAKLSGAEVQASAGPAGMMLSLKGCAEQLDTACNLLQLLIDAGVVA